MHLLIAATHVATAGAGDGFTTFLFSPALFVGGVILIALYCLPSILAFARKRPNAGAICALNLLLGWSAIGWVVSLVWALTQDQVPQQVIVHAHGPGPEAPLDT